MRLGYRKDIIEVQIGLQDDERFRLHIGFNTKWMTVDEVHAIRREQSGVGPLMTYWCHGWLEDTDGVLTEEKAREFVPGDRLPTEVRLETAEALNRYMREIGERA